MVNPTLTNDEIEKFEKKHNCSLPEGYKQYLLRIGNGGAGFSWHDGCDCGRIDSLDPDHQFKNLSKDFPSKHFPVDKEWGKFWMADYFIDEEDGDEGFYIDYFGENYLKKSGYKSFKDMLQLPDEVTYDDGTINIAASNGHTLLLLVLRGNEEGMMWFDGLAYDYGLVISTNKTFLEYSIQLLDQMIYKNLIGFKEQLNNYKKLTRDRNVVVKGNPSELKWNNDKEGYFIDSRNGKKYGFVKIKNQIWMIDYLDYQSENDYEVTRYKYSSNKIDELPPPGWRIPSIPDILILNESIDEEDSDLVKNSFNKSYWTSCNIDEDNKLFCEDKTIQWNYCENVHRVKCIYDNFDQALLDKMIINCEIGTNQYIKIKELHNKHWIVNKH